MTPAKQLAAVRSLPSRHALHVSLNVSGTAVPVLAGVLTVPALVARLGQEHFATLALGWTIVAYFSLLDLGLGRALTLHIARHTRTGGLPTVAALARMGRRLMLALGGLWTLMLLALFPLVEGHWPVLLAQAAVPAAAWAMLVLCIPATLWLNSSASILEARSRFVEVNAVRIPLGISTYVGPLLVALSTRDMGWVFASLLLTRLLGATALAWQVRHEFVLAGPLPPSDLRSLLRFGGWMTVSQVVGPVLVYFDRFAIAAIVSAAAVTQYTVPFDVLTRLPLFPMAVMSVLFPLLVRVTDASDDASEAAEAHAAANITLWLLLAVWIPSTGLAALLGPQLLRLWLGDELGAASAPVWQWLIVGVAVNGLAHLPLNVLQSRGRTDIIAGLHLVQLLPYVLAVWWALGRFGIAGAAMVWTLRVALDAILLHICAIKLAPRWHGLLGTSLGAGLLALGALTGLAWLRS